MEKTYHCNQRLTCLKVTPKMFSEFFFKKIVIISTGKQWMDEVHCFLIVCCFSSAPEYFAHMETSPLTVNIEGPLFARRLWFLSKEGFLSCHIWSRFFWGTVPIKFHLLHVHDMGVENLF